MWGQRRVVVVVIVFRLGTVDGKEFLSDVGKKVALCLNVLYNIKKDGKVEELQPVFKPLAEHW
jgi:hypothetical protein